MDKTTLKNFAVNSRKKLIEDTVSPSFCQTFHALSFVFLPWSVEKNNRKVCEVVLLLLSLHKNELL